MEYINCNLCNGKEYKLFKEINGYRLVKCKQCGLVYLNPRPTQQEINEEYSAEYHIERLLGQEPKTEKEIEQEINKNIGRAEEIVKQFGNKGKLLDIGCGTGFFIACLKRYGWKVTGMDISEWASKFAREKLGLNVFTGSVEEIQLNERFDVITMYHNLEHLPYPLKTLKSISEILTPNGVLVIKGPNLASFDRIWHGKCWRGYTDPSHLFYFTPKTYCRIIEKVGFSVQKTIFQYWDPVAHLMETRLGDGARADHPPDAIKKIRENERYNNFIFKGIHKIGYIMAKLLNLKGRDLTIYAKKMDNL
jgi:2-polyprenyl-3-methyl-5-hydroxy-6-metoxy-1,4-benzoquinol methylase